jgi:putative flippase GtrA
MHNQHLKDNHLKRFKSTFVNAHFSKFLVAGTINSLIDLSLFTTFSSYLKINIIIANIMSTSVATCVSYLLNKHFVFKKKETSSKHLMLFVFWTLVNVWIIQSVVIVLAHEILKHYIVNRYLLNILTKLIGIASSTILNYLRYRGIFLDDPLRSEIKD